MVEFAIEFAIFAVLLVVIMAFMGSVSSTIAELFGGSKKEEAYQYSFDTKKGWKAVGGRRK